MRKCLSSTGCSGLHCKSGGSSAKHLSSNSGSLFPITRGGTLLRKAAAVVTTLICWDVPLVDFVIIEVLLGLSKFRSQHYSVLLLPKHDLQLIFNAKQGGSALKYTYLFLRDWGMTDSILKSNRRILIVVLDDMDKIPAEGVFVDVILDLQR